MPVAGTINSEVDSRWATGCVSYNVADHVVQDDRQQALVAVNYDARVNHTEL
jgi:hypothetical protein